MNAGFSSLSYLKSQLLAEAQRQYEDYDDTLTALGQGVAAAFEKFCNRKFYRTEDDTVTFSGAREVFVLPRYPVENVTAIELQSTYAGGWVAQDVSQVLQVNLVSGLVRFGGTLGSDLDLYRLTYTGGYWWSTTESADGTETAPAGAASLPADILEAWLQQCHVVWDKRDKLGLGIGADPDVKQKLGTAELTTAVKERLTPHIRYQLT